jgi:RNA polymerase sigma factor (sigma-70 family)
VPTSVEDEPVVANGHAVDYAERNKTLFRERRRLFDELAAARGALAAMERNRARTERRRKQVSVIKRLERQLDSVTGEIVRFNYGLMLAYVRRFLSQSPKEAAEDFEGAGRLGLMRAINTYDPELGSFAQWAYRPIKREVLRAVKQNDHPTLRDGDFERRPAVLRAVTRLANAGVEHPTPAQVAAEAAHETRLTPVQVQRILSAPQLLSLDTGDSGGDDNSPASLLNSLPDGSSGPFDEVSGRLDADALARHGLHVLEPRELFVLVRRYGLDGEPPARLSTLGTLLDFSRETARQTENRALSKLGHPIVLRRLVRTQDRRAGTGRGR